MNGLREDINMAEPQIMHIDLNSCFAMVEQQSKPHLRGKPLGVTNRITKHACMIALSYEAKALGAKVGMRRDEVEKLVPGLIVLETDPPKYHYVYQKLVAIMKSYSPNITMKSIDEGVIDFTGTRSINSRSLVDIGHEIKQRLVDEVGEHMTCNIGISTNRFLAKLAAGQNKPNGLTVITGRNIPQWLGKLKLTDLPGIASKFERRLVLEGIYSPTDFLVAPAAVLKAKVFKSIYGEYWHQRLRGWEVDDVATKLGIVGRQYVLESPSIDETLLQNRLAHLSYSTGRKLRYNVRSSRGVYVYARMRTGEYWFARQSYKQPFFSDQIIYEHAKNLFATRPKHMYIKELGVTCYKLEPLVASTGQLDIFGEHNRSEQLTHAIDAVNDRYGMGSITFAVAMGASKQVKQKLPFGSIKYFALLCGS